MRDENSNSKTNKILIGFVLAVAVFLTARSLGLYPVVADEYTYSKLARLVPFSEANVPGYLYIAIYSATSSCGDGFLDCARLFNVVFFVSATPFIYFVARKVTGEKIALVISVLSMLGPINTYTAYFMPESMYFFSFWVFTWFLLRTSLNQAIPHWVLLGALFGLTSLIKPHAILLLPALAVLFFVFLRQNEDGVTIKTIKPYAAFFASAVATKFLIGFILAGKPGLTVFGPNYTSYVSDFVADSSRYIDIARLAFENLQGHLLALVVLFSVPVAQLLLSSKYFFKYPADKNSALNITLYTSLVFAVLLAVVVIFTASVANIAPTETITRLHMRYYNFAFPLLLIVAASQISVGVIRGSFKWRTIIAFPIGVAILYAVYTRLAPYTPLFVDSPELRGFTFDSTAFYVLSGISLCTLALWVYAAQAGAKFFIYLFMPLSVAFSSFYVHQELRQHLVPDVYDKAGILTKQYLPNEEELSKLFIIGSETGGLFRMLFHLDFVKVALETIPNGSSYNLSKLPAGREWILAIGDYSLLGNVSFQLPMDGFTLARTPAASIVDFKKPIWPGIISRTQGLSFAETWGTWSSGDSVTLEFSMPLPEKFTVHLVAYAFGPNVGKEFVAHVGDSAIRFTLGASPEERVLEFNNPKRSSTIKINIPSPASPKELGLSADERSLGIAFTELRVTP